MKIDRRTLAWINNNKEWIRKTSPDYSRGCFGENASLPSTDKPTINMYNIGNKTYHVIIGAWGAEEWQHSRYLYPNDCICPKCRGIGDERVYFPDTLLESLVQDYKDEKLDISMIYQDWIRDLILDHNKEEL